MLGEETSRHSSRHSMKRSSVISSKGRAKTRQSFPRYRNEKHEDKAESRSVPSRAPQRDRTAGRKLTAHERIPGRKCDLGVTWKSSLTYRCTYRRCSWPRRCLCPDKVAHHGWAAARRSFSSSCECNRSRTPTMRTIWTIRRPRLAKRRVEKEG